MFPKKFSGVLQPGDGQNSQSSHLRIHLGKANLLGLSKAHYDFDKLYMFFGRHNLALTY